MRKKNFLIIIACFVCMPALAQKYQLTASKVSFFSDAPMEDIKAVTSQTKSIFDAETGDIAFLIPIKSFVFDKKLMQEHFNENYMESDKYPDATFKGRLIGYDKRKSGEQKAVAKGVLTIHGVARNIETEGTVEFKNGKLLINAKFPAKPEDYKIDIPTMVVFNIAEEVEINVYAEYKEK